MTQGLPFTILRIWLYLLGAAAVVIGAAGFLFGVQAIGATQALYDLATGRGQGPVLPWPTFDNELRFYESLWFAYGIATLGAARRLRERLGWVRPLALIFFAGGVGRAISCLTVGPPHPVFVLLMAIELVTGPLMLLLAHRIPRGGAIDPALTGG